jgi:hypothetical protein
MLHIPLLTPCRTPSAMLTYVKPHCTPLRNPSCLTPSHLYLPSPSFLPFLSLPPPRSGHGCRSGTSWLLLALPTLGSRRRTINHFFQDLKCSCINRTWSVGTTATNGPGFDRRVRLEDCGDKA